ncbi:MAG TPA: DUF3097 family protein [Acidimicrobiales bacterium]|nr:DUF3097 family protein [Acidimicrobiales bacterium]
MSRDGILSGPIDLDAPRRPKVVQRPAGVGDRIEYLPDRIRGTVSGWKGDRVLITDARGITRPVPAVTDAFVVNGERGRPIPAAPPPPPSAPTATASGSIDIQHDARVARGSRMLVEGIHDAELIEKVWGDDLRYEGIVVERLDGMDDLAGVVRGFNPSRGRRLGILLDHLVAGTKESRAAEAIVHPHALVCGHPSVDVWQAIRPAVAGIDAWPEVPMGEDWKHGVLDRLGVAAEPGRFWKDLLGRVESYKDLEPPLVNAVERLIDFVTDD